MRNTKEIVFHAEDMVMKTAMAYFAKELLPVLGIGQSVVCVAPTELVVLEARQLFMDFNFVLVDGSWAHFEFQSSYKGQEDLKRFREYEAITSRQYGVEITTYVIFSGEIKNPVTELTEGINTYRVVPVFFHDWSAESVFSGLEDKLKQDKKLDQKDFLTLVLTPVMAGKMGQTERFEKGFRMLKDGANMIPRDEMLKLQAMLYTFASKFLDRDQFKQMKEELKMTWLGEMLIEDALEQGMEKGIRVLIAACMDLGLTYAETLEKICKNDEITKEKAQVYMEKYWVK